MNISQRIGSEGRLVIDVIDVDEPSDFKRVISVLVDELGGKVMDTYSGPGGVAVFASFGRKVAIFDLVGMVGMSVSILENDAVLAEKMSLILRKLRFPFPLR